MTDNLNTLADCPFCGAGNARQPGRYTQASFSGVEVMDELYEPYVWCGTCCARTSTYDSVSEAVTAWNRRAHPQPTGDVGALVEDCTNYARALRSSDPASASGAVFIDCGEHIDRLCATILALTAEVERKDAALRNIKALAMKRQAVCGKDGALADIEGFARASIGKAET